VIATAAGGTTELIEAGDSGLIVPAHDPGALRDALARLVSDGELRGRLGDAARRTVRRHFDWLSITDTLETELWELRDGSQGPRVCHISQRAV
jgi:glycosyltransferase involved in cell wall biosynthesis